MGRPPLPIGTYGEIWTSEDGPPFKARARFRDRDGKLRPVARFGPTKTAARNALRAALADRQHHATDQGITPTSTVTALAREWLAGVEASEKAARTKETYAAAVDRYVIPKLGAVRIQEVTTSLCDSVLAALAVERGPAAAKHARSVMSSIFRLAVRHDALTVNPMREAVSASPPRRAARALTRVQADEISDWLRADERAVTLDLPDIVDFGLATGCRIGEAMAIRESRVDLEAATVTINATAVRIRGRGVVIQDAAKSDAGHRVLPIAPGIVEMIRRRITEVRFRSSEGIVFSAPFSRTVRDPSNTSGDLRACLNRIDCPACKGSGVTPTGVRCRDSGPYEWVTFHTFRKTVATWLDEAGLSGREIADFMGHSKPSMTQDHYMGRKVVTPRAADILGR